MDDDTVAVNKNKIYKLINVKKYDKARSYLYEEQNNVYQMAIDRLKPYIDNKIIYEDEVDIFLQIIEENLIYNMLKDSNNIGMNFTHLDKIIEKKKKLEFLKKIRNC